MRFFSKLLPSFLELSFSYFCYLLGRCIAHCLFVFTIVSGGDSCVSELSAVLVSFWDTAAPLASFSISETYSLWRRTMAMER